MESGVSPLLRPYLSLLIILAESMAPKKKEIEETIRDINETQVEDEEVLSDHVYYYNAQTKTLCM